jgi:RimJ/RimL family protein N-acetyltransferase
VLAQASLGDRPYLLARHRGATRGGRDAGEIAEVGAAHQAAHDDLVAVGEPVGDHHVDVREGGLEGGDVIDGLRPVLRPLAMNDLDDLAVLHAEESFWRYPFGRGWSRSETRSFLERTIERYQDPGVSVSAIVVAESGELAGRAGLSVPTFLPEILPAVEVGWRFGERHRGPGFATEAGTAWARYGFEELG